MLSHRYCQSCGHIATSKAVEEELIKRKGILIGSVGCAVALPDLFETVDAVSSAHGRALSVATGLRRVLPNTPLISYQGDGDCCTIGIGELVHTILRNERIVCVIINNSQFGMTGHQMSAMTPLEMKTKTTVEGRKEENHGIPLDIKLLAKQNPKVLYQLCHSANKDGINMFKEQLKTALDHPGFAIIEVLAPCPTFYGNTKKAYEYTLKQYKIISENNNELCHCIKNKEYWEL